MIIQRGVDIQISTDEQTGEVRRYHLFDSFELIITDIPPRHVQPRHRHSQTVELYYVIVGRMTAYEGSSSVELSQGEVVCIMPSPEFHTVGNQTDYPLKIATFKVPLDARNYREQFKQDKVTED
jgi:quercetin dioxygenase-like cupin family protein